MRKKSLQALQSKGTVGGMSDCVMDLDFCDHCIYG